MRACVCAYLCVCLFVEKPASPFHRGFAVLDSRLSERTSDVLDCAFAHRVQSMHGVMSDRLALDGRISTSKTADVDVLVDNESAMHSLVRLNGGDTSSSLSHLTDLLQCATVRLRLEGDIAEACRDEEYVSPVESVTLGKDSEECMLYLTFVTGVYCISR